MTSFTVTAAIQPSEIVLGQEATLSGSVTPVSAGTKVRIQRRKPSGWVTIAERSVDLQGYYRYTMSPARIGTYPYRARMPSVGSVKAANSPYRILSVVEDPAVVFTIPAGTGSGPWNTSGNAVTAKVGDTLRIINGDSVPHRLHTDGTPFPHPALDLGPGQLEEYLLQKAFTGALYCHTHGSESKFWLTVTDPSA